jgi:hypothetical protein
MAYPIIAAVAASATPADVHASRGRSYPVEFTW